MKSTRFVFRVSCTALPLHAMFPRTPVRSLDYFPSLIGAFQMATVKNAMNMVATVQMVRNFISGSPKLLEVGMRYSAARSLPPCPLYQVVFNIFALYGIPVNPCRLNLSTRTVH